MTLKCARINQVCTHHLSMHITFKRAHNGTRNAHREPLPPLEHPRQIHVDTFIRYTFIYAYTMLPRSVLFPQPYENQACT